jgi:glycogen operon protein
LRLDNPATTADRFADAPSAITTFTGCGNSVDFDSTPVIRLVMDSLRYWMEAMHVDGFRFDLSVPGRGEDGSPDRRRRSSTQCLRIRCSIARFSRGALDLGTAQVGNFPIDWSKWNGLFRTRSALRQATPASWPISAGAHRIRRHTATMGDRRNSVNFITYHDGFTLNDLVSYTRNTTS